MNRRGFLEKMLAEGAAFTILPSATLYTRQWRPKARQIGIFDPSLYTGEWLLMKPTIFRRSPWVGVLDKAVFPEGVIYFHPLPVPTYEEVSD